MDQAVKFLIASFLAFLEDYTIHALFPYFQLFGILFL